MQDVLTHQECTQLEDLIRRAEEHADEVMLKRRVRLTGLGSCLGISPPDPYWPTNAEVARHFERDRRILAAARTIILHYGRAFHASPPKRLWGDPGVKARLDLLARGWRFGGPGEHGGEVLCPHGCGEPMRSEWYVNAAEDTRTFWGCTICGLHLEAHSPWFEGWERRPSEPDPSPLPAPKRTWTPPPEPAVARRPDPATRPARVSKIEESVLAFGQATFDRESGEWYRPLTSGSPMIVTGRDDTSGPATETASGCWACCSASPHSYDYHEAQVQAYFRRFVTIRQDDDGTVRTICTEHGGSDGDT